MADSNQVRINELARELEIKAKVLIEYLPEIGVTEKKTHSSSIDNSHAELVRKHFLGLAAQEAAAEAEKTKAAAAKSKPSRPAAAAPPAAARPAPAAPAAAPVRAGRCYVRPLLRRRQLQLAQRLLARLQVRQLPLIQHRKQRLHRRNQESRRPAHRHHLGHRAAWCGARCRFSVSLRPRGLQRLGTTPGQAARRNSSPCRSSGAYRPTGAPPSGQRYPASSGAPSGAGQGRPSQGFRPAAPGQSRPGSAPGQGRPGAPRPGGPPSRFPQRPSSGGGGRPGKAQ